MNAEDRIKKLRAGEAVFSLMDGPNPQVVFLVSERSAVTKYFGATGVEVRSGLLPIGDVAVTVVAFRVGQYFKKEYVTWWNYHQPGCEAAFKAMTGLDFLSFHFYGDNARRDRTFVAITPLRDFFSMAIEAIRRLPSWSESDFLAARLKILSSFPTPRSLWENLPLAAGNE